MKVADVVKDMLYNNYIYVGNYKFYPCEIELYVNGDPYKHMNVRQNIDNVFYVHRCGKEEYSSYKGGNYKGLDYVLTNKISILIRSIIYDNIIIEGPSLVVDHIIKVTGHTQQELESVLKLGTTTRDKSKIYIGTRVGLTLKKCPNHYSIRLDWAKFLLKPYRFSTIIPKKYKDSFLAYNINRTDITIKSPRIKEEYEYGIQSYNDGIDIYPSMTLLNIAGYMSALS